MSFRDKFLDCIEEVRRENEKIRKIVVDGYTVQLMMNEYIFYAAESMEGTDMKLFGYRLETDHFGTESKEDFLIFTDRRVVHSDMLEKNFVEDLDVEELLDETNKKIETRETTKDL